MPRKTRRPPLAPPPDASSRLYIRLPQPETGLFRNLLEAYDNLACTTVVDRKACILKIIYSPQGEKSVRAMLGEIAQSVPFSIVF